jgi:hypothetical protein
MHFLRFLMSLSLILWIGGILFFVIVMTRTLFAVLPKHLAGSVVNPALHQLHWIGIISGIVFLGSSLACSRITTGEFRPFAARHILVVLMLALTCISQFAVTPQMAPLRAQMATMDFVPAALQAQFNALNAWSTRLEGGVLLLGIVLVCLTTRE